MSAIAKFLPVVIGPRGMDPQRETAELLLQIGRHVQAVSYGAGLNPAQWMALRYFSRANSFSRTPSAFAKFQATTRGTASVAIKELKTGGYLAQERSKRDGRSIRLRLTAKGSKALARDPFGVLVGAIDALDAEIKIKLRDALEGVMTNIAARAVGQRFGPCQNCTHLVEERHSDPASICSSVLVCQRHSALIQSHELYLLCAYFQPSKLRGGDPALRKRQERPAGL